LHVKVTQDRGVRGIRRGIVMLKEPGRYDYLPLIDRPRIQWPNGARVAFWVCPNIEFYELAPPDGQGRPLWSRPFPDILNYSLRDYGNRAGVWRLMEALEKFGVRASVSMNAAMCEHMPEIVDECRRLKWELFSHGIYNTRLISGMTEDEAREVIRDSVATISRHSGEPVHGWLAPAISATETFLDLLPEFGIKYTIDVVPDDQPVPIHVRRGRLIAVPYSTEINDIRIMGVRGYPAQAWAAMIRAAFDQLYQEGAENGMVLCVPLHPFVVGQPHRIDALHDVLRHVTSHDQVWLATAREIADFYYANCYEEAVRHQPSEKAGSPKAVSP
jgi:peptidoglycan/xylan/chitin deacetylase (PgdA/CDA1 family)